MEFEANVCVWVDENISEELFFLEVQVILHQSWNWYFTKLAIQESEQDGCYRIGLVTSKWIQENITENEANLSYAIPSKRSCYINLDRWNGIDPARENRLNLWQYRYYLINHEFGHLLGLNHPEELCKNTTTTPMMNQHTLFKIYNRIPLFLPTRNDFLIQQVQTEISNPNVRTG